METTVQEVIANPDVTQTLVQQAWAFVASPAFMVSAALFFVWMFFWRMMGWFRAILGGFFTNLFYLLSPNKWRRVFFNGISLLFMVGGVAASFAAKASLTGGDPVLSATVAGGAMLGLWGTIMLVSNQVERYVPPRPKTARKAKK